VKRRVDGGAAARERRLGAMRLAADCLESIRAARPPLRFVDSAMADRDLPPDMNPTRLAWSAHGVPVAALPRTP